MKKFSVVLLIFLLTLISGCNEIQTEHENRSETSINNLSEGKTEHYQRSEKIMGTIVTLKADGAGAKAAVDESFDKIFELVENIISDLKKIHSADENEYVEVSPEVYEILKISQKYSEQTQGAFDVTVGAAVDLWKAARKSESLPTEDEIETVKNLVGFQHLHLHESDCSVMIDKQGVKIDVGGVAKGYGADIARKIFVKHNIKDGLIDFGTSTIFAFGEKRIGLKNPRNENELTEIIKLNDAAISTSGDYEKFFVIDGRRYHHIINPKTCQPVDNGIASVSVVVGNEVENCGTVADILSTSVFILGEQDSEILLSPKNYQNVLKSP